MLVSKRHIKIRCITIKLKSLKPNKIKQRVIYTFDYETDSRMVIEKLVCLCKYNPISDKYLTHTFFNTENFIMYLFDNKIDEVYAFNLKFDSRFFLDFLLKHPTANISMIRGGSTILSLFLDYNKQRIRFRDFYPFCLCSLDSISKSFNLKNKKYPNFEDNDKENWNKFFETCSIEELEKHCIPDVKMLAELINKYKWNFFNEYKIDITHKNIYSLAGLSMKVYRTHFITTPIENPFVYREGRDYKIDKTQYNFVRRSYHGGYTGNIDNKIHYGIISFDISSSYPYQATKIKFPTGQGLFTSNKKLFEQKTIEIPGFCEVSIDFTDNNIKFPLYDENLKEFRSIKGIWSGVITSLEYYYLIDKKIPMVFTHGLYYTDYDRSYSLKNYMLSMYDKKKNAPDLVLRHINKRLLTNLTGKFGQRIDLENRVNERILPISEIDNMDCEETTFFEKITENVHYCYEIENSESIKGFTIPSWISLICARGRIQLLKKIEEVNALYWDTDSVYCYINQFDKVEIHKTIEKNGKKIELKNYIKNGKIIIHEELELGLWMKEHEFIHLRAFAPKLYAGLETNNEIFVRNKGINLDNDEKKKLELYNKIMNNEEIIHMTQLRPYSIRQSLRIKNCTDRSVSGLIKSNEYVSGNKRKIKN